MLTTPAAQGNPPLPVRLGIEVLLSDSLHLVRGRAVGLVTNYAAVDRQGVSILDRLRSAGVRVVALFSPEHGFRGAADPGETVASTVDSATGLPIYSLYGRTSAPTDTMLAGIEVILVDLPDVGARYYTYLSTTIEVMRAAEKRGRPVLVLDRPNPIGGAVQGNVLEPDHRSFVGMLAVPMRHGLTLGEAARLANDELALHADLTVVPAQGWQRREDITKTALPFRPPSQNLLDVESLFHYPGLCLFEATALSVGRGTDAPFRQIGAPWLDTTAVLAKIRQAKLKGVAFEGVTFTPARPGDRKFSGVGLPGVRLRVTDAKKYDPTRTAVALLTVLRDLQGDRLGIDPPRFDELAGGSALRLALAAGASPDQIVRTWREPLQRYLERRKPYLLYR